MIYISMYTSKYIGIIIIYVLGITYVNNIIKLELDSVVTVSLAAIGILAGLSGLCVAIYSAPAIEESDKKWFMYCCEKFLHSCILIIQALAVKYSYHYIVESSVFKDAVLIKTIITIIFTIILLFLCSFAVFFMHYGFDKLNDILWDRYIKRKVKIA